MAAALTILVADDDPSIRLLLRVNLEAEGVRVVEAGDGDEAVRVAATERPAVAVLDGNMPGSDGAAGMEQIRSCSPQTKVAILSGHSQSELPSRYDGADAYFQKPVNLPEFCQALVSLGATMA